MIYISNIWPKPCPKRLELPTQREYAFVDTIFGYGAKQILWRQRLWGGSFYLVKRVLCICSTSVNDALAIGLGTSKIFVRCLALHCLRWHGQWPGCGVCHAITWNILVFPLSSSSIWNCGLQVLELHIYSGRVIAYDRCSTAATALGKSQFSFRRTWMYSLDPNFARPFGFSRCTVFTIFLDMHYV